MIFNRIPGYKLLKAGPFIWLRFPQTDVTTQTNVYILLGSDLSILQILRRLV